MCRRHQTWPHRNDLIEEQILQIETDRALHSVEAPAGGRLKSQPGGAFLRKWRWYVVGIWFEGPINSWETLFWRFDQIRILQYGPVWLEICFACNRSEHFHPNIFTEALQVRVDLGWILYCNWCNLNELLTACHAVSPVFLWVKTSGPEATRKRGPGGGGLSVGQLKLDHVMCVRLDGILCLPSHSKVGATVAHPQWI